MGGGGGTFDGGRSPDKVWEKVRKAEEGITDAAFDAAIAETFNQLLATYNDRDTDLVNDRLGELKHMLGNEIEGTVDSLFGGSVSKHTYIDGFSDIDSLLVLDKTELSDKNPQHIVDHVSNVLESNIGAKAKVSRGDIAITVEFSDGMKIQLLPALRTGTGLRVPAWKGNTWSDINPEKFSAALKKRNNECGGKLIPTIKLAKAINSSLPEPQQLTGYHIESLAIAAFSGYEGPKYTSRMLPHLLDKAKDLVLSPIRDRTGQSVHVDDYLGPENSKARQQASHILNRISKRMRNATVARSQGQWLALFGD